MLVPSPTYPLYTAVLAKIGARAVFYRTDPATRLAAGPRTRPEPDHARDSRARRDRSEQSDRRDLSRRCAAGADRIADRHDLPILADEVYGDLAYDGPVPPMASLDPDAPIISFSSLSKAYLAPGWRAGWLAVGRTDGSTMCSRR